MLYLVPRWHRYLSVEWFGVMLHQHMGDRFVERDLKPLRLGAKWALDNGKFTGRFDEQRFFDKLVSMQSRTAQCLFVVVPDEVGNVTETLRLYPLYADRIRAMGYRVAYAAQDGAEHHPLPDCDAVFIGGSTEWKLGAGARQVAARAKAAGKWLHVGRVNTRGRIGYCKSIEADSVDGTHLIYEPDKAAQRLSAYMRQQILPIGGVYE